MKKMNSKDLEDRIKKLKMEVRAKHNGMNFLDVRLE